MSVPGDGRRAKSEGTNDTSKKDLTSRTRNLALRVMRLCDALPHTRSGNVIANQVLRAGTSPGAQYREGLRSRSVAESISKLQSALQELEETAYWLEIIVESKMLPARRVAALRKEVDELIAMFVTCVHKLKRRRR